MKGLFVNLMRTASTKMLRLLFILALFSTCVPGFSEAQNSRFSPLTRCLEGSSLSCIVCDTSVTVSSEQGVDCRPLVEQDRSLSGITCRELDDVLKSIASLDTMHMPGGCIEVMVVPKAIGGAYTVLDDPNQVITQNVVIRGGDGVQSTRARVTLVRDEELAGDGDDLVGVEYALQFRANGLVGVSGMIFDGGTGRVGVENVGVLDVENSVFQYFSQGALDVYDTPTVLVSETEFLHNGPFSTQLLQEYRGDSAGLSVAVNRMMTSSPNGHPLLLHVYNCTFTNNSVGTVINSNSTSTTNMSDPVAPEQGGDSDNGNSDSNMKRGQSPSRGEMFGDIGGVVVNLQFTSRGGGLAVIVNDEEPAEVEVWSCVFSDNEALAFGGGMYVGLDGRSRHSVNINLTEFRNNSSPSTGGGLHISFLKGGQPGFDNQVTLTDTLFHDNEAEYGGGVYFLPLDIDVDVLEGDAPIGVFIQFKRCSFTGNHANEVGGAFGGAFHILSFNTKAIVFMDCTFNKNSVGGSGIVSIAFYPIDFRGDNHFIDNRGASLSVIGSRVTIHGSLLFRDNSNVGGVLDRGSLYVTSQGQIELTAGATLSFVNNSGITGAGLYVEAPHVPRLFSKFVNNPLCVFLFEEEDLSPNLWHTRNVSVEFHSNQAMVSSAVYINNLDLCSWASLAPPFFDKSGVFYWNFINYTDNVNYVHNDSTDPQWAMQTPPVQLDVRRQNVSAFPGQRIDLRVSGLDELNSVTALSTRLFDDSSQGVMFLFEPSSISLRQVNTSSQVTYFSNNGSDTERRVRAVSLLKPNRRITAEDSFTVTSRSCPPGLEMFPSQDNPGYSLCDCDEGRAEIITCRGRLVVLNTHLWGSNNSNLSTFPCPVSYCRCLVVPISGQLECNFVFDSFQPNDQCSCNRTGVLCGDCPEGAGVSVLLNRCVSCSSLFTLLVPLLVIIDTGLIVFLLVIMLPMPSWLYPVLCYVQLLPHFTEFFPVTFELVRPYLYYVASATGLYFPYDFCLSSELDAVGGHALRYLPPLLAIVISVVILLVRSKMMRPNQWHGVWWLVLMLYTPAVYTSMSALYCPSIPADNEPLVPRWHTNGNVQCFNGTHVPLGLLAILVLGCCTALIPICILISLKKLPFPGWVRFLEEPLTHAYKDKCKWWSGVELGKRLVLVTLAVVIPNNEYGVIFGLMIVIAVCSYRKPYKLLSVNLLDLLLSCDVLVLLMLRNVSSLEDIYQVIKQEIVSEDREGCGGSVFSEVTQMVAILTPFYYVPLAVGIGLLIVFSLHRTYRLCQRRSRVKKTNTVTLNPLQSLTEESRPRTQTVVDLNELDPETPDPNNKEVFQFKSSTPLFCVPEETPVETESNGTQLGAENKDSVKETCI